MLVYRQPYGVALIIGAWNYPIQLCFVPMAAAIAAGNCVILKPSEVAVHSTKFLTETIPKYLDNVSCKIALKISKIHENFNFRTATKSSMAVSRKPPKSFVTSSIISSTPVQHASVKSFTLQPTNFSHLSPSN